MLFLSHSNRGEFIMPKVKNYRIIVADTTSKVLHVPIYEMPLLKAKWASYPLDPKNGITSSEVPDTPICQPMKVREFESIAAEIGRLRASYAIDPRTRGPLFDLVYPDGSAERAIQAEIDRFASSANPPPSPLEAPVVKPVPPPVPPEFALEKVNGVGRALAEVLRKAGFLDAKMLAAATPGQIEKLPGIGQINAISIIGSAKSIVFRAPDASVPTKSSTPEGDAAPKR